MIAQTKQSRFALYPSANLGALTQPGFRERGPMLERLQFTLLKAAWRYRYFLAFMVFGFLSILLEVALVQWVLPGSDVLLPVGLSFTSRSTMR